MSLDEQLLELCQQIPRRGSFTFLIHGGVEGATFIRDNERRVWYKKNKDLIEKLILNGANVNYHNKSSLRGPLTYACVYKCYGLCKLLLENGAEVDQLNRDGSNLLMVCAHNRVIVKILLEYDIDTEVVNTQGSSVMDFFVPFPGHGTGGLRRWYDNTDLLKEHIHQKNIERIHKRLTLGKLFYSDLGKNLMEEGLYEKISFLVS